MTCCSAGIERYVRRQRVRGLFLPAGRPLFKTGVRVFYGAVSPTSSRGRDNVHPPAKGRVDRRREVLLPAKVRNPPPREVLIWTCSRACRSVSAACRSSSWAWDQASRNQRSGLGRISPTSPPVPKFDSPGSSSIGSTFTPNPATSFRRFSSGPRISPWNSKQKNSVAGFTFSAVSVAMFGDHRPADLLDLPLRLSRSPA